jgi:hypothetical protein
MTIDPGVGTSGTQYEPPRVSLYHSPGPSTRAPKTQPHEVQRNEQPHRQTRTRDIYNLSLIKRMFDRRR